MSIKRVIAAGSISLFALSSILTPAAFANYDSNRNYNNDNHNNYRNSQYFQQLKTCVRILNDNRSHWKDMDNNNWNNNNWGRNRSDSNLRQNLRLCMQILNARHNWNDHNYWDNWYNYSNQNNWENKNW